MNGNEGIDYPKYAVLNIMIEIWLSAREFLRKNLVAHSANVSANKVTLERFASESYPQKELRRCTLKFRPHNRQYVPNA